MKPRKGTYIIQLVILIIIAVVATYTINGLEGDLGYQALVILFGLIIAFAMGTTDPYTHSKSDK